MTSPLVSVIIPVKNAAHLLECCLQSLQRQRYPALEVIVVDNGSTDTTVELAIRSGANVLSAGGRTPSARNVGARAARGEFLLHIDADMELDPESITECVAAASHADVIVLPERNIARGYWMWAFSFGKELVRGAPGFEYGRFLSRRLFELAGGYDEQLHSGEDRDLFLRLIAVGGRPGRIEALTLHHVEHLTIGDMLRKTAYYTSTRPAFLRKHATVAAGDRTGLLRLVASRWRLLATSPLRAAGWLALTGLFVIRDTLILRRLRAQHPLLSQNAEVSQ